MKNTQINSIVRSKDNYSNEVKIYKSFMRKTKRIKE